MEAVASCFGYVCVDRCVWLSCARCLQHHLVVSLALVLPNSNSDGTTSKDSATSTRVGRPSSSLHLWDAERMALLGTLLLPCLALTRDLANAAAAFSVHAPHAVAAPPPVNPNEQSPPTLGLTRDQNRSSGNVAATSAITVDVGNGTIPPEVATTPSTSRKLAPAVQQPAAMVKAGTGLSRPALVTALAFLSPHPLLVGTSTGGAVALWRTSDCVCVQVRRNADNPLRMNTNSM